MTQTGRCQRASHRGMHKQNDKCINWHVPADEKEAFKELLKLVYKRLPYHGTGW